MTTSFLFTISTLRQAKKNYFKSNSSALKSLKKDLVKLINRDKSTQDLTNDIFELVKESDAIKVEKQNSTKLLL